ncbi:fumarylacetoacetate hydrolase family protein [Saccharopolyspora pogona]|uniref:fumarylacetoacetate hydrolase family protein n=1 Tax=Saccharopolyspora pogona TaxID=333966 RepID=UPI001CC26418|nr:fumarylacetoacetate hydrolase family protein [Saccharopolyspora pogona]
MPLGTFHVGGGESLLYQAEPGAPWRTASPGAPVDDLEPAPRLPFRLRTIFGIGLNYHDTVAEMGWQTPEVPYLFPKLSSSAIGDGEAVVVDTALSTRVDWETELAVIIGRRARQVPAKKALDVVFGYHNAVQCAALQGGGEAPRREARRGLGGPF